MSESQKTPSHRCPVDDDVESVDGTKCPETEPAQERGERLDTARTIARGGKTSGDVPGATEPDEKQNRQQDDRQK